MLTLIIMVFLTLFLGGLIWFRDTRGKASGFFDLDSAASLRGFWCLIILLVHVPADHQNLIQDLLGSFAYIGVTFFFMTSGYGLMLGVRKKGISALDCFWQRRLPKLLVPMMLMNLLTMLMELLLAGKTNLWGIFGITGFVRQLLTFYFVFWIIFRIPDTVCSLSRKTGILILSIPVISLLIYFTDGFGVLGWPTESFGFLYGILLAKYKDRLCLRVSRKWLHSCVLTCVVSLVLGVLYLKWKSVAFLGDYLLKILLGQGIILFMLTFSTGYSLGNPVSRFLGSISYEVYLLHSLAFFCLDAVWAKWDSGLYVLISILLTVLFAVVIHKAGEAILDSIKNKRSLLWLKN